MYHDLIAELPLVKKIQKEARKAGIKRVILMQFKRKFGEVDDCVLECLNKLSYRKVENFALAVFEIDIKEDVIERLHSLIKSKKM